MASWDGRLLNFQARPPETARIWSGGASFCPGRQALASARAREPPAATQRPPWFSWSAVIVMDPTTGTGLPRPTGGAPRSRSSSTHGQPVSGAVSVKVPLPGSVPRLTGDEPVVTSAASVDPAGETDPTLTVTRIAEPASTTGASGASRGARSFSDGCPGRAVQVATWANRCGSTASTVSPLLPLDVPV